MKLIPISSLLVLSLSLAACSSDEPGTQADENESHDDHDHDDHDHDEDHDHDDDDHSDAESGEQAPRLIVADGASSKVAFVDPHDGKVVETFELTGPARVYTDPSRQYAFAIQRTVDLVSIFDSGLEVEDHGVHAHYERNTPEKFDLELMGGQPTHFTAHGEHIAVFMDGRSEATDDFAASGSEVHVLDLTELSKTDPEILELGAGGAHHGVAVPWSPTQFLLTEGSLTGPLPDTVRYVDENGDEAETYDCPVLHGEAANDELVGFGCGDGVLFLQASGDGFESVKVPNPADAPEGTRVGTIKVDGDTWLGNWGSEALVHLDPETKEMTPIDLGLSYYSFQPVNEGKEILILGKDGDLHLFSLDGELSFSVADVTAEPDPDAPPHSPTGSMAVYNGEVFITNPETGAISVVSLKDEKITHTVDTQLAPTTVAVLSFAE